MPGDKTANVSPKTKNPPNNQRKSPKSSDQDLANVPIKNKRTDIIFKEGTRLEARDRIDNKWWTAKVLEVDTREKEVLIHFHGWNIRHDEWISMESQRLRPASKKNRRSRQLDVPNSDRASYATHGGGNQGGGEAAAPPPFKEFREGDEVMALWNKTKYPAKILRFEPDGSYLLEYYDGIKKKVLPKNIRKLSSEDAPFIKSCQEDLELLKEELRAQAAASGENTGAGTRKRKAKFNVKEVFNIKTPTSASLDRNSSIDSPHSNRSASSLSSRDSSSSSHRSTTNTSGNGNLNDALNSTNSCISTNANVKKQNKIRKIISPGNKGLLTKKRQKLNGKDGGKKAAVKSDIKNSHNVINGGDKSNKNNFSLKSSLTKEKSSLIDEKSSLTDEKSSLTDEKSSLTDEKSSLTDLQSDTSTSSQGQLAGPPPKSPEPPTSPKPNCDTNNYDDGGVVFLNGDDKIGVLNGETKEENGEMNGFSHSSLTSEKENKFTKKVNSVGGTKRKSESQDIKTTEMANSRKRKKLSSGGQPAVRTKKAAIINSRPVMTARDGSANNQISCAATVTEKKPTKEKAEKNKKSSKTPIEAVKEDNSSNSQPVTGELCNKNDTGQRCDNGGAEAEPQYPYLSLDFTESPENIKKCLQEGVVYPGPGKPVCLRAPKLPEGWKKMVYVRTKGITNGKWDVYTESPLGEVFRSKMELSRYVEKKKLNSTINIQDFDFVLDPAMKRIRGLWRQLIKQRTNLDENTAEEDVGTRAASIPNGDATDILGNKDGGSPSSLKQKAEDNTAADSASPSITTATSRLKDASAVCTTPSASLPGNYAGVSPGSSPGSSAGVRCNLPDCNKLFRNGTLLLQHVKHYHSYLTCVLEEYVGNSPTVTDMAYSRTRLGDNKQEFSSDTLLLEVIAKAAEKYDKRTSPRGPDKKTSPRGPDNNSTNRSSPGSTRSKRYASRQGHQQGQDNSHAPLSPAKRILVPDENGKISADSSPGKSSQDICCEAQAAMNKSLEGEQDNNKSQGEGSEAALLPSTPLSAANNAGQPSMRKNKRNLRQLLQVDNTDAISPCVGDAAQTAEGVLQSSIQEKETCSIKGLDGSPDCQPQDASRQLQQPPKMSRQITPPTWKRRTRQSNSSRLGQLRAASSAAKLENDASGLHVTDSSGAGLESGGGAAAVETMTEEELVQCLCRKVDGDGLMVQCEVCLSWQHGHCTGLYMEEQVPDRYICLTCRDPPWGRGRTKYLVPLYYNNQDKGLPQLQPSVQHHQKRKQAQDIMMARLSKLVGLQNIVCQVASLLHSLRTKLSIAGQPNHPKVFMWSSLWEQRQTSQPTAVDNSLELFLAAAGDAFGCETAASKLTTATNENSGYNSQTELSTELQLRVQNKFLDCLASPNNHIGTFNFCKELPVAGSQSSPGTSEQPTQYQVAKSISSEDPPSSCDSQLNGDNMETIDSSHGQVKGQVPNETGSEPLCTTQNHRGVVCSGQEQLKLSVSCQEQIGTFDSGKEQIRALDSGNKQPEPFCSSQQQLEARSSGQTEQEALENSKEDTKQFGRSQEQLTTLGNTMERQLETMGSGQAQQLEESGSSQQQLGALGSSQEQQLETSGSIQQLGALGSGQEQLGVLGSGQGQLGALGSGQEQLVALDSGQEQQLGALGSGQEQLDALDTSQGQLGALGSGQDQLGALDTSHGQLSLPDFEFPSLNEVAQLLPGVLQDISQSMILNEHPVAPPTTTTHQQQQITHQQQHPNLIPEPKLIDREECRANLVHHIEFLQEELSQILDTVENEVATLESLDPLTGPGDRHLTTTQVCSGVVTRLILHLACIQKLASRSLPSRV